METAVLDASQPAGITAAVAALERLRADQALTRPALPLAVEQARDAAHRAPRPYDRVAPAPRLGAGARERRWHEPLAQVAEAAARLAAFADQPSTLRAAPPQA